MVSYEEKNRTLISCDLYKTVHSLEDLREIQVNNLMTLQEAGVLKHTKHTHTKASLSVA
jgi:hypothetical protein